MSKTTNRPTVGQANPKDLIPNDWNVNVMSPDNELKLERSITRVGMFKPVVVRQLEDGTLQIIGGEHRAAAAVRLGLKEIPFVNMGEVSDAKAKEVSVLDNARYGHDDALQLAELLEGLGSPEELSSFMPYTDSDIASIFSSVNIALDDLDLGDDDEVVPTLPREKPIQTHQIMRFKIPVGDVKNITDMVERVMKSQKFVDADSLANVGDALVFILSQAKL